jgi:hypothetical protein
MQLLLMDSGSPAVEAFDFFDALDVKTLADFERQGATLETQAGVDDSFVARFKFQRGLIIPADYIVRTVVSDDLQLLSGFTVKVRGALRG